jgi:hypothetical protein
MKTVVIGVVLAACSLFGCATTREVPSGTPTRLHGTFSIPPFSGEISILLKERVEFPYFIPEAEAKSFPNLESCVLAGFADVTWSSTQPLSVNSAGAGPFHHRLQVIASDPSFSKRGTDHCYIVAGCDAYDVGSNKSPANFSPIEGFLGVVSFDPTVRSIDLVVRCFDPTNVLDTWDKAPQKIVKVPLKAE